VVDQIVNEFKALSVGKWAHGVCTQMAIPTVLQTCSIMW
jgi:hypothetical protein